MNFPISRRRFGLLLGSATVISATTGPLRAFPSESRLLLATGSETPEIREIQGTVLVHGDLKLNPDGKEVRRMPLDVHGEVQYDERALSTPAPRGLRHYTTGNSQVVVGKTTFTSNLRDQHRLIGVGATDGDFEPYSLQGPLNRDELEILHSACNTLVLHDLLPASEIAIDERWKISETTLARWLNIEVVHQSDIQGVLKAIETDIAILYFEGTLQGSSGGVATEIELKAKANFDRARQFLSWINLAYKENRTIGHAEPGYEALFKMKLVIQAKGSESQLTEKALADVNWRTAPFTELEFRPAKAPFKVQIGRHWRVVTDDEQTTIIRLVDRGELIAQGDISMLAKLPAGKSLPLEEFQQEVENALGDNFGQFAEASQSVTEQGVRLLRVAAVGTTNELSIQWNYYHLSNHQGQQAAMVFTCESDLLERLQDQDQAIAQSFQFTPVSSGAEKTSADSSAARATRPTNDSKR